MLADLAVFFRLRAMAIGRQTPTTAASEPGLETVCSGRDLANVDGYLPRQILQSTTP
jgi:hypothetical protein